MFMLILLSVLAASATLAQERPLLGQSVRKAGFYWTCPSSSPKACGAYCIPVGYICCADEMGGCPTSTYCTGGSKGGYGCCPLNELCSDSGWMVPPPVPPPQPQSPQSLADVPAMTLPATTPLPTEPASVPAPTVVPALASPPALPVPIPVPTFPPISSSPKITLEVPTFTLNGSPPVSTASSTSTAQSTSSSAPTQGASANNAAIASKTFILLLTLAFMVATTLILWM